MSKLADVIVTTVLENLWGRAGFDDLLDSIDEDVMEELQLDLINDVDAFLGDRT